MFTFYNYKISGVKIKKRTMCGCEYELSHYNFPSACPFLNRWHNHTFLRHFQFGGRLVRSDHLFIYLLVDKYLLVDSASFFREMKAV